ncbi:Carboxylic ester hydrolase [Fusarium sp. LHS14.1]|nr:Carboxylic ester hydrolase [Fusarium sp. LHS14.1]
MLPNGTIIGGPNSISSTWIPFFLQGNTSFDVMQLTVDDIVELFAQSAIQWGGSMGTDIADISAFRDAGGKLLTWHGMADENVPPNGTVLYRTQVEDILGGNELVNQWYRVFLAPGVGHCSSRNDYGPVPVDSFAALVDWVENGIVPETLPAAYKDPNGAYWTKNLGPFPKVPRYDEKGDPTLAGSYSYADSYVADN